MPQFAAIQSAQPSRPRQEGTAVRLIGAAVLPELQPEARNFGLQTGKLPSEPAKTPFFIAPSLLYWGGRLFGYDNKLPSQ
jgi:hypothetical protein